MNRDDWRHIDSTIVDISTGDILYWYSIVPYVYPDSELVVRHYSQARDEEELFQLVKQYGEKRYSELIYLLNRDRLGVNYYPVLKMCSAISYYNIGFYSRNWLCETLKVKDSNLNRLLNKFVDMKLFTYSAEGLTKRGVLKFIWNPLSAWKGWNGVTRIIAIQCWYKSKGVDFSLEDLSFNEDCLISYKPEDVGYFHTPDPYVSPYFSGKKDKFKEVMDLSDAEFELALLDRLALRGIIL